MGELIFVGLGLGSVQDMSLRALTELRSCDVIYGEFYTSKLVNSSVEDLESLIGKKIVRLKRADVEEGEEMILAAKEKKVAFVTAGDTMAATTHVDIRLRAEEDQVPTRLVHGTSIFSAASSVLGLQPYKFGRTVTLPFPEPGYVPLSPYERILENKERGLHTLVLLDIREEEGRYMTSQQAVQWLLDAEARAGCGLIRDDTIICSAARVGGSDEKVAAGYPKQMLDMDMGAPLHTLVIPGKLHFMEAMALVMLAGAPKEISDEE
ncbi:MAG: diphthine synthase [Euryarchaeota archaeon]|nr:diphthine synthase [Euryarchaeota archaeon]